MTPCGEAYEHNWHSYRTPRGKIKICDGVLRNNKEKKNG